MKQNNASSDRLFERVFEEEQQKRVAEAESEARREEAKQRTEAKRVRRTAARVITTFVLIVVVLAVLFGAIYWFFFRISELQLVGCENYTPEQVFEAAGVKKGDHLYSFSSRVAESALKKKLPYIKSLTVKREMPGRIIFTVEENKPRFYAYVYGRTCVMSADLTVLEIVKGKTPRDGLCYVALPAVMRAVCGERLELRSDVDRGHIENVVDCVNSSELSDRISAILASDTYSLSMECDKKYLMNFGNYSDCEIKIRLASVVLRDSMFDSPDKMKIDLSNTSETTVVIDNTVELH